jgi:hypothetical protein
VAYRLQVAIKQADDDALTIAALRKEATHARKAAILAEKQTLVCFFDIYVLMFLYARADLCRIEKFI